MFLSSKFIFHMLLWSDVSSRGRLSAVVVSGRLLHALSFACCFTVHCSRAVDGPNSWRARPAMRPVPLSEGAPVSQRRSQRSSMVPKGLKPAKPRGPEPSFAPFSPRACPLYSSRRTSAVIW